MHRPIDPRVTELNSILDTHPVGACLSSLGRRIYFPKGIVRQSLQAKDSRINATAGVAYSTIHTNHNTGTKEPLILSQIQKSMPEYSPSNIVSYAPTTGNPQLRTLWQNHLIEKNPSLNTTYTTLPIVTVGLTHALELTMKLFVDPGTPVLIPTPFWENYALMATCVHEAQLLSYPIFTSNTPSNKATDIGFNIRGLHDQLNKLVEQGAKKCVMLLNFPHNPTGYSLKQQEAHALVHMLHEVAKHDLRLVCVIDDAYYGILYEQDAMRESLFSSLVGLHPNIIAVKLDGATKEYYSWGLRLGFITIGISPNTDHSTTSKGNSTTTGASKSHSTSHHKSATLSDQLDALQEKIAGLIRTSVSNSPQHSQSMLLRSLQNPKLSQELSQHHALLYARYRCTKDTITTLVSRFPNSGLDPLPANSGYFVAFKHTGNDGNAPEILRTALLETYSIGVVALGDIIRFTFASVEIEDIPDALERLFILSTELNHSSPTAWSSPTA